MCVLEMKKRWEQSYLSNFYPSEGRKKKKNLYRKIAQEEEENSEEEKL